MGQAPNTTQYPQATPEGAPIPFEIIRPYGLITQLVEDDASDPTAIPADADFLILRSTTPCYVCIGGVAEVPVYGTHLLSIVFVDMNEVIVIDHDKAAYFTVICGAGADDGVLTVQTCVKYTDVRKRAQMDRA